MQKRSFYGFMAGVVLASSLYGQVGAAKKAVAKHYTVEDLGLIGGAPGQPVVIRNNRLIAGSLAASDTTWHSTLWFQGLRVDIGKIGLGGRSNVALGVNDPGQAVGQEETTAKDANGEDFCGLGTRLTCAAFVMRDGAMWKPPMLRDGSGAPGNNAAAGAINLHGQIVGSAETTVRDATCPPVDAAALQYQKFEFKPVIWENGKAKVLPTIGTDPDGNAFSVNDQGHIVGATGSCTSFQASGDLTYLYGLHATIWIDGAAIDLGHLGSVQPGGGNTAITINNRDEVVGASGTADGSFHGFYWSKGTGIRDLGTIPGDGASVALGISDKGEIVGISFDEQFNGRAFIRH